MFLDLKNVFGTAPFNSSRSKRASQFKSYFQDHKFCIGAQGKTTAWQHLENCIMADCTISSWRLAFIVEPNVPSENAVDELLIKFQWYANLAVNVREWGWKVQICLVEVSCRGFVASSTARLLRDMGIRGQDHRKASPLWTDPKEGCWNYWDCNSLSNCWICNSANDFGSFLSTISNYTRSF